MTPAIALEQTPGPIAGPGRPSKYLTTAGKQVPGTTTIAGRFGDKSGLIKWAHQQGWERIPLDEARDKAADAGTVVHGWIEDDVHARPLRQWPYVPDELTAQAQMAFGAFKKWAAEVGLRVIATEIPLVHSALGYGGTLDTIALVEGRIVLADWKSGNRCYAEHLIQQAAYRELLRDAREQLGDKALPVPDGACLVRLDKATGEPHARSFDSDSLDVAWEFFEHALRMYRLDQSIEKMVAPPRKKAPKGGKAA